MIDRRLVMEGRRGVAFAVGAAMLFGSAYVATAFQLRSFSPLGAAAWRNILGAAILLLVLRLAGRPLGSTGSASTIARLVRLLVLGAFGGLFFLAGMNLAVQAEGATITAFVAGLYAILAALLAPIVLRERLGRPALAGFACALVGTAFLAELDPARLTVGGLGAAVGAAISYAAFLVLARRWSGPFELSATTITLGNFAVGGVGLTALAALDDPAGLLPARLVPEAVVALAWLVFVSVVAQLLIMASVRRVDARRTSAALLLNPLTAAGLSALLLGERLTELQLGGGALVLVGMAVSSGLAALVLRRIGSRAGRWAPVGIVAATAIVLGGPLAVGSPLGSLGIGAPGPDGGPRTYGLEAGMGPSAGGGSTTQVGLASAGQGLGVPRAVLGESPSAPDPRSLGGYIWPLPHGRVTNTFGPSWWSDTALDGQRFHDGLDLATFCGDRIVAAHDGIVMAVGRKVDPWMGWIGSLEPSRRHRDSLRLWGQLPIVIVIDDGNGYRSIYAHFNATAVTVGQRIRAGGFLGWEGRTGFASGCHLHYGLFSPFETATMELRADVAKRTKLPSHEIARIDPLIVLPGRAGPATPAYPERR
jgi:probable blue pigment (indigoidine) exporter